MLKDLKEIITNFACNIPKNGNSDQKECFESAKALILESAVNLQHIVETLQTCLTDKDPYVRCRGIEFLTLLLEDESLASVLLDQQQVVHLTAFLEARLSDQPSVPFVVRALLAISRANFYNDVQIYFKLLDCLFDELVVQNYAQQTRYAVFQLLDEAFSRVMALKKASVESTLQAKTSVNSNNADLDSLTNESVDASPNHPLKENGLDKSKSSLLQSNCDKYVKALLSAIDGEKDPRCLITVFGLVERVLKNFNVSEYAEEFFDILFCYFPITFRTPKDNPVAVTAESLKCGLARCLSSTALFAELAVPNMVEKLQSASIAAKEDTLVLMEEAFPVYGAESLQTNYKWLLETILDELETHATDDTSDALACKLESGLACLVRTMSESCNRASSKNVLTAIVQKLSLVKNFDPCPLWVRPIVQATVGASDQACVFLLNSYVQPVVFSLLDTSPRVSVKKELLKLCVAVLNGCAGLYGTISSQPVVDLAAVECEHPLAEHVEFLQRVFSEALLSDDEELQAVSLRGLASLVSSIHLLPDENRDKAFIISEIIHSKAPKALVVALVREWASVLPQCVLDGAVVPLLARKSFLDIDFEFLCSLCVSFDIAAFLLALFATGFPSSNATLLDTLCLLTNCIFNHLLPAASRCPDTLLNITGSPDDIDRSKLAVLHDAVLAPLFDKCLRADFSVRASQLDYAAALRLQTQARLIVPSVADVDCPSDVTGSDGASDRYRVATLAALLTRLLRPEYALNALKLDSDVACAVRMQLKAQSTDAAALSSPERRLDVIAAANMVNKRHHEYSSRFDSVIDFEKYSLFWNACMCRSLARAGHLDVIGYTFKRCSYRDFGYILQVVAGDYTRELLVLSFGQKQMVEYCERGGMQRLGDWDEENFCLEFLTSPASRCACIPGFKQQLLSAVWPLIDSMTDRAEAVRIISSIVLLLPLDIAVAHSEKILPLVLCSDELDSINLLEIASKFIKRQPALLLEQLDLFMARFVPLLSHSSPKVRFYTLDLLVEISLNVEYEKRAQYQHVTKKTLKALLDDPKMLIRKQAVLCFNLW